MNCCIVVPYDLCFYILSVEVNFVFSSEASFSVSISRSQIIQYGFAFVIAGRHYLDPYNLAN
ncbi:7576_t:CDS:2, partial [Funneliformis geosporum]